MHTHCIAAVVLAALSAAYEDLCAMGSSDIDGNRFCQPVEAIRYSNVGTAGSYEQITAMSSDGTCLSELKFFSGPLAPLNEEVSLHFRGPLQLKQFAAYSLSGPGKKDGRSSKRHDIHEGIHKVQRNEDTTRQMVTATIDGNVVSWVNKWPGDSATSFASDSPAMVTATINGQTVSWTNNWFGGSQESATKSPEVLTATINGQFVSWVDHRFEEASSTTLGPAAGAGTPVTFSSTALAVDQPDTSVVATWTLSTAVAVMQAAENESPSELKGAGSPTENVASSDIPPVADDAYIKFSTHTALPSTIQQDTSVIYERIGYYDSASQTLENLVFLGNYGGQGSGVFDNIFGASVAYANRSGTGGAGSPQILAETTIPSGSEVIVMLGQECDGGCGYTRPGTVAHHGFDGADKVFLIEFSMPIDGKTGFNGNMPAIWMLNAQITRNLQYGDANCSCWASGCGEFDIAEALYSGSTFLKSTLHTNHPGGDSDYLERPTSGTMKLAVIFLSGESAAHIQVMPHDAEFPGVLHRSDIVSLCKTTTSHLVSHFRVD